jgi:hypothetical protein
MRNTVRITRITFLLTLLIVARESAAQYGGRKSLEFLNVPVSARLSGLGGVGISHFNKDINYLFNNPSAYDDSVGGWASANYLFYVADIGQTSFSYAHDFGKIGMLSFGVQHIGYGEIVTYDVTGAETGSFHSGETAVLVGKNHAIGNYRVGANLKFVTSNIAGFRASALMLDFGGMFVHPTQDLTIGLVIRNFGVRLSNYSGTERLGLPFDVQLGSTFHPAHMPLRFTITAYNLTKYAAYDDPSDDEPSGALDKALGHLNFGVEVLLHRNVNVLLGYNFLRRQELKGVSDGAGLSLGLSAKIKTFELVVSRATYSAGNASYALTLATNIDKIIKPGQL